MTIPGFGGASKGVRIMLTYFHVQSRFGRKSFALSALVVPKITVSSLNPSVCLDHHEHLANLGLADEFSSTKDSLREDSGETERGSGGPIATKSALGWLVSGPIEADTTEFSFLLSSQSSSIDESCSRFWDIESIGIKDEVEENESLVKKFKASITHNDKRYEIPLSRKDFHPDLTDNQVVAKQRLFGLEKKFQHHPELFKRYGLCGTVGKSLKRLILMIQHCVVREDRETTKMRIVFNASCSSKGSPSLNQCLEAGPSLNPELFDILLRFRLFPIALVSYIEKAFHMISVPPADRDVLRFLWFDANDQNKIITFRQKRLMFVLNVSPFILTIQNHTKSLTKEKGDNMLVEEIKNSLYVDGEFEKEAAWAG